MTKSEKSRLDQESHVPLFMQIRLELLSEILNWPDPNKKFYGDNELVERFGVSRMTVRQAISEIVSDGLLKRFSGQGTFVTDLVFVERLDRNLDIAGQYAEVGVEQQVRVMTCEYRIPTDTERDVIDLDEGEDVLSIIRIRSIASTPLAVDERLVAGNTGRRAGFTIANAGNSIIERLRTTSKLSDVRWMISAGIAGNKLSTMLLLKPVDAVLERRMTYRTADHQRILCGRTIHQADMVRYGFDLSIDQNSQTPREMVRATT